MNTNPERHPSGNGREHDDAQPSASMTGSNRPEIRPPAQDNLARLTINRALRDLERGEDPTAVVSPDMARVIAASLHVGPQSPLERYAATGRLRRRAALHELRLTARHFAASAERDPHDWAARDQLAWNHALRAYIETSTDEDDPKADEGPDPPGRHIHPAVYVARIPVHEDDPTPPLGAWIDATLPPDDLRLAILSAVLGDGHPAMRWAGIAMAGFYDLPLPDTFTIDDLSQLAVGIADYGEAYAVFADWQGMGSATAEAFNAHYEGTFPTYRALAEHYLRSGGWYRDLDILTQAMDVSTHVGFDTDDVVAKLHTSWHLVTGTTGIHAFRP